MNPKIPVYKNGFMLEDGTKIYFGTGKIDGWCVFIEKDGDVTIPLDYDYFTELFDLCAVCGKEKVYRSFCIIYDSVEANDWTLDDKKNCYAICKRVSAEYEQPTLKLWLTYYMAMLAEEMKDGKILGKRIKRLGVYNMLFDEYPIKYITGYIDSQGNKVDGYMRNAGGWRKLNILMVERGI